MWAFNGRVLVMISVKNSEGYKSLNMLRTCVHGEKLYIDREPENHGSGLVENAVGNGAGGRVCVL